MLTRSPTSFASLSFPFFTSLSYSFLHPSSRLRCSPISPPHRVPCRAVRLLRSCRVAKASLPGVWRRGPGTLASWLRIVLSMVMEGVAYPSIMIEWMGMTLPSLCFPSSLLFRLPFRLVPRCRGFCFCVVRSCGRGVVSICALLPFLPSLVRFIPFRSVECSLFVFAGVRIHPFVASSFFPFRIPRLTCPLVIRNRSIISYIEYTKCYGRCVLTSLHLFFSVSPPPPFPVSFSFSLS